jgi:energy-coupling factor transporter transmembrane protein EcfT
MDITFIIGLIVFIIASTIIFKIVGKAFKAVIYISTLFSILILIMGFFVYQDAMDIKENFPDSEKLILLDVEGKLAAGMYGTLTEQQQPEFVSTSKLKEYQANYKSNMKAIQGDYYKIFIIKESMFDDVGETLEFGDYSFSKEDALDLLKSEDALEDIATLMIEEQGLPDTPELREQLKQQVKSSEEAKALMFGALFTEKMKDPSPVNILNEMKDGNIVIYPETIVFKLVKSMPLSLMQKFVKFEGG